MKALAIVIVLLTSLMAQDMPKQDDKDIPHPAPTFEIDPQPEIPLPPLPVNPDTCLSNKPCSQRLLLKA